MNRRTFLQTGAAAGAGVLAASGEGHPARRTAREGNRGEAPPRQEPPRQEPMTTPIRIHPDNGKLFEFRGRPAVLLTPTEHYGAVMNRPFEYEHYLADCAEKGINFTRLFLLFRELQNHLNPYSTCKPESTDYVAPWPRVAPELAMDGQFKYNLDEWNPEFFERLHGFLSLAAIYGVVVEVVLFSNTYGDPIWMLNPLNAGNNRSDVETIPWHDYITTRHPKLWARQQAFARNIVTELNEYDNIVYEVCNEPGGNVPVPGAPSTDEVNAWLDALIGVIRDTEKDLPNQHLVFGQEAFAYSLPGVENTLDVFQFAERSFRGMDYDVVNMHPLSNMRYGGKHYHLGRFMHAEMHLAAFRDYSLDVYFGESKPLCHDEDNCASQYRDHLGWTIHRKRAWTSLFCGAHYDYIDFSVNNYLETGTAESNAAIRTWFRYLSEYIHGLDLVRCRPLRDAVTEAPAPCVVSAFGIAGEDVSVYLADGRERLDPEYGDACTGILGLDLPEGRYAVSCFCPVRGGASPGVTVSGGPGTSIELPEFEHDLVVRIVRKR